MTDWRLLRLRDTGTAMAAIGGLVAVAWWITGLRPFTVSAGMAVTAAGVAAIAYGRARPPAERPLVRASRVGVAGWLALVAALVAWQLAAYVQSPRAEHPTLSWLANGVLEPRPVRALAFLLWLGVGIHLARR